MTPPFPMMVMKAFIQKAGDTAFTEYLALVANGEVGSSSSELVFAQGEIAADTTGTIVSYTPANGKDFYLAHAGIHIEAGDVAGTNSINAEVQNDGNIRDTIGGWSTHVGTSDSGGQGAPFFKSKSGALGDKLVGDGAKIYRIFCETNDGVLCQGSIVGILLNNGESPRS